MVGPVAAVLSRFAKVANNELVGPARTAGFETNVIGDSVAALEAVREGKRDGHSA